MTGETVDFVDLIRHVPERNWVLLSGEGRLLAHDPIRARLEDRRAAGDVIYRKNTQVFEYEGRHFKVSGTAD